MFILITQDMKSIIVNLSTIEGIIKTNFKGLPISKTFIVDNEVFTHVTNNPALFKEQLNAKHPLDNCKIILTHKENEEYFFLTKDIIYSTKIYNKIRIHQQNSDICYHVDDPRIISHIWSELLLQLQPKTFLSV